MSVKCLYKIGLVFDEGESYSTYKEQVIRDLSDKVVFPKVREGEHIVIGFTVNGVIFKTSSRILLKPGIAPFFKEGELKKQTFNGVFNTRGKS